MFIVTIYNHPKLDVFQQIIKLWYIHAMEYSTIKKKKASKSQKDMEEC